MTPLKRALHDRTFVCVMEFVPKPNSQRFAALEAIMARTHLCGWPLAVSIGDRVASPLDLSPLDACASFTTPVPTLLHFSGKDRERQDLLAQLPRMDAAGLDQLLLLTGDRLPGHTPGQRPVRYLESVGALHIVRQARPDWLLGAALNPFKYREEEGGAQYFKAEKKLSAGADFLILQLGFDVQKYREAMAWMQRQPSPKPMLACIMALTEGRAKMLDHVAGVTVSPGMRALLAAEAGVSKAFAQDRATQRLALQVIGLRLLGYAGINLSGIHELEPFLALEQALEHWLPRLETLEQWGHAWDAAWRIPGVPDVTFHPPAHAWQQGQREVRASAKEKARYHLLAALHHQLFSRQTLLSKAFGWAVRRPVWSAAGPAKLLHRVERSLKRPLVGCDTCGQCRLEDTLYICPETCPKGLANGPCGGTQLNRCEFGDRECIHSRKYRTAVSVGQAAVLSERLIPCVEVGGRHQSSWPRWFAPHPPIEAHTATPGRDCAQETYLS
ncbi:methylenetetrahydrofolate reductase C-terminal domain-containing protein [Pseudomonas entomophila]|uniref:methylenetetrahydrofolate reductase C-terminal domain-containing protein n=1 Tax=Pseudomonas entomophila TaxID=312306 RepID=UPI0023D85496|nr:methylenetetrahydrofolate reductase C-terminal domain-containing protein [Pseudomonas entomophila]MDF0732786.1 methylenetetrahydrofolate reductase C-terminal domain-containing protein [Pseudomonas entomophila]